MTARMFRICKVSRQYVFSDVSSNALIGKMKVHMYHSCKVSLQYEIFGASLSALVEKMIVHMCGSCKVSLQYEFADVSEDYHFVKMVTTDLTFERVFSSRYYFRK